MAPLAWVARTRSVGQGTPPTLDEVPLSEEEESWFTETQHVQRMASCLFRFRRGAVKVTNKIKNTSYETANKHDKPRLLHLFGRIWRNHRKQKGIITGLHAVKVDTIHLVCGVFPGSVRALRGALPIPASQCYCELPPNASRTRDAAAPPPLAVN